MSRFLTIIFCLISFSVHTQEMLTPASFFGRCYAHFTGERVPQDHALLAPLLRSANMNLAVDQCMKLYDSARLEPLSYIVAPGYPQLSGLQQENDLDSLRVLNHFFAIFDSFFEEKGYGNRPQTYSGMTLFWDRSEDALMLLRAAFEGRSTLVSGRYTSQFAIDQILQTGESVTGKRLFPHIQAHSETNCRTYGSNCSFTPTSVQASVNPKNWLTHPAWDWRNGNGSTPGSGPLAGLKIWPSQHNTYYSKYGNPLVRANHYRVFAGGVLGSTSFMLKNAQYSGDTDGGMFNRRRIIKHAFDSFLCRSEAPLQLDHPMVLERVNEYRNRNFDKSQTLAFRESQLCASCHVTYDDAAAVYRNLRVSSGGSTRDWNDDGFIGGTFGYVRDTDVYLRPYNSSITVPEPNLVNGTVNNPNALQRENNILRAADFRVSPPDGRLIFVDYRGRTINVELSSSHSSPTVSGGGIQALGEAMSQTDQFYACLTKRLLYHFTGIDIPLENPNDFRIPVRSQEEEFYLTQVVEPLALGGDGYEGLRSHKSIRRLIYDIINSDFYRNSNLRKVAGH
jgi:hypothetical protein